MSIGVPIKVLHEAEGHIVTVETMLGEVYRGKLLEAEDNMNVQVRQTKGGNQGAFFIVTVLYTFMYFCEGKK